MLVLPTAYLPNLSYISALLQSREAEIEIWESYPKQTFRNRCEIASPNGRLNLTVPVLRSASKQFTKDVQISYASPWQRQHWQALVSSYRHTPYFDYYEEFFAPYYTEKRFKYLIELNDALLDISLRLLRKNPFVEPLERVSHTTEWRGEQTTCQLVNLSTCQLVNYHQIFSDRCGFQSNLSIVDFLFNQGGL